MRDVPLLEIVELIFRLLLDKTIHLLSDGALPVVEHYDVFFGPRVDDQVAPQLHRPAAQFSSVQFRVGHDTLRDTVGVGVCSTTPRAVRLCN